MKAALHLVHAARPVARPAADPAARPAAGPVSGLVSPARPVAGLVSPAGLGAIARSIAAAPGQWGGLVQFTDW